MKKPRWYISRRTVLQTAGTSIALPVLEAMILPKRAMAQTAAPPRRFLAFHGQLYGYIGKTNPAYKLPIAPWSAKASGASVALENNSYLRPFFDKKINSKVTVLTGIADPVMVGTHDSPVKAVANTYPVAMQKGGCVILVAAPGPGTFVGPPPQPDPFKGATVDQIIAKAFGKNTFLPYLTMGVERVGGSSNFTMSNKSTTEPIPQDRDPTVIFNRLFAGFSSSDTQAEILRRAKYRKSVLDGVTAQSASLRSQLGKTDQRKLDEYLESVRSLERNITPPETNPSIDVKPPAKTFANNELKQRAMQDLIVMAFATDRTRVVAFSGAYPNGVLRFRSGSQTSLGYEKFREFGGTLFSYNHHTMSHTDQGINGSAPSAETTAMKKDWMEIFTHWSLEMYAELLAKLESYKDLDGSSVLDNTIAIYSGDDADSARHRYNSMPCILGGLGGKTPDGWRIKAGREMRFPDMSTTTPRTWKDLLWGALNIVGVPDPSGKPQLQSFGYAKKALDTELAA